MPSFSCTKYFTYVPGADNQLHRAKEQVWNIGGQKGAVTVYIQGALPSELTASGPNSYFAKKHLLTYSQGDDGAKAARVSAKRVGERAIGVDADHDAGRYGNTIVLPGGSTFVYCHELTPAQLEYAFYKALTKQRWTPRTFHKTKVWFTKTCVSRMSSAGNETSIRKWIGIGFVTNDANTKFAITHGE